MRIELIIRAETGSRPLDLNEARRLFNSTEFKTYLMEKSLVLHSLNVRETEQDLACVHCSCPEVHKP